MVSEGQISLVFEKEMSMVDPILKYIKDSRVSTQNEAKKVINCISLKITDLQWIQNMLYEFLQLTTIENADLQSHSVESGASLDEIEQKQRNLNTFAECMSYLLKNIQAIPLALAESTLKGAKNLVLGSFAKSDAQEKEAGVLCYPITLQEVIEQDEMG